MTCANNCKGVNPNAVIIGGTAVLLAAAVTPLQVLTVGVGAAVAAGGGAVALSQMMSSSSCPATRPCNVSPCFFKINDILQRLMVLFPETLYKEPRPPGVLQSDWELKRASPMPVPVSLLERRHRKSI